MRRRTLNGTAIYSLLYFLGVLGEKTKVLFEGLHSIVDISTHFVRTNLKIAAIFPLAWIKFGGKIDNAACFENSSLLNDLKPPIIQLHKIAFI